MEVNITKSARKYGYIIWNASLDSKMKKLLGDNEKISVCVNGFSIGEKNIDWKYHRISIGLRFTRSLGENAKAFSLKMKANTLEVTLVNGNV